MDGGLQSMIQGGEHGWNICTLTIYISFVSMVVIQFLDLGFGVTLQTYLGSVCSSIVLLGGGFNRNLS